MTSEYESIKKTLERATELSAQPKTDFMELGRCLQELRAHPDGLKQFLSLSGMSRRKAYYLVSLAERALGWGVTEERLRELGWTKCEVLDSHFKKLEASGVDFDIEELLKLAEGCTAQQLKSELKTGTAQRKTHCVTMYLTPRQYRIFEDAVLSNGGSRSARGLKDKERALIRALAVSDKSRKFPSRTDGRDRTLTLALLRSPM